MNRHLIFTFSLCLVVGFSCSRAPDRPGATASTSAPKPAATTIEASTLQSYLVAFNRHDSDAVTALLAPDVKWFSVDSDKLSTEAESRDAIRAWLTRYFEAQPDVRAEFLSLEQTGTLVAVRQSVTWTAADRRVERQQSHAVFEIRQGLIHRVWYFPAARLPEVR